MNMIDRVARAIEDNIAAALPDGIQVDWEYAARAAIEAMREPTEAMESAADDPVHDELKNQGQFSLEKYGTLAFASYPFSSRVWKAMIDAALEEK